MNQGHSDESIAFEERIAIWCVGLGIALLLIVFAKACIQ